MAKKQDQRGSSAAEERRLHTPEAARSTRAPATKAAAKANVSRPDVNVFIAEYKIDRNGRRAAIAAGYSPKSADAIASRLLRSVKVREELDKVHAERIAKVHEETGITLERTLREIAKGAFHDSRKFFNADGSLKAITELDDETASALSGFEVNEISAGSGEDRQPIGQIKKIKMADRKGYLDMLMKHLGGYEVDNKQKGEAEAEALKNTPANVLAREIAYALHKGMQAKGA